jgi:hypothetical protein
MDCQMDCQMDCKEAQERILDGLEAASHLAGCGACREFEAVQRTLDHRLAAALPAPVLSPEFRSALRRRIRREPHRLWPDSLPDLIHLGSCGAATVFCAVMLPFSAMSTLGIGAVVTAVTYLLQAVSRSLLEEMGEAGL